MVVAYVAGAPKPNALHHMYKTDSSLSFTSSMLGSWFGLAVGVL